LRSPGLGRVARTAEARGCCRTEGVSNVARHRTIGSFGASGVSPAGVGAAVITALCLIGVFAAVVASCGGQNVTARSGDLHSSDTAVAQLTTATGDGSATNRIEPGPPASEVAVIPQTDLPIVAAAPPIAALNAPTSASGTPTKALVLTSTRPAPTSKPPAPPGQYVTPGAACSRAGAMGVTSTGKRAICWPNSSRRLVWIVF
jgi:hypothetical protein